jgi:hypothetical protein
MGSGSMIVDEKSIADRFLGYKPSNVTLSFGCLPLFNTIILAVVRWVFVERNSS